MDTHGQHSGTHPVPIKAQPQGVKLLVHELDVTGRGKEKIIMEKRKKGTGRERKWVQVQIEKKN